MKRLLPAVAVCAVIVFVLRLLGTFDFPARETVYTVVSVLLFVGGGMILKVMSPDVRFRRFFAMRPLKKGDFGILVWLTVLVMSGSLLLNYLSVIVFSAFGKQIPVSSFASLDTGGILLRLLYAAVIPAVFEEFFFRGAVLSYLNEDRSRTVKALLLSSVLFALVHGSYYYIVSNIFAGVVFGLIIYMTGSLYVAVLSHFLSNSLSYLLYMNADKLEDSSSAKLMMCILGLLFLVALYRSLGSFIKRYKRQLRDERPMMNEGDKVWQAKKEERRQRKKSQNS